MGNSITLLSRFTPHSRLWRRLWVTEAVESPIRPMRADVMDFMENLILDKSENYDVFLSHRGPDTKTGFVSFLYKDLKRAGLQPFLDCRSIDFGEDAWKSVEDAIKMSPISIVIFSENFAQSEWCMKELHVMLEAPGIKVLPIFYNIQPWEVRFPEKGKLKDGFEKLKRRYNAMVIEQWRADLQKASKLIGWEHPCAQKRLEGELVTEVAGKVFDLANKPLPLDVGEYVVGVEQVAKGIMHTLDHKKSILLLGLWGMGGVGKSTLARELYNQLSRRFAASCYVEDVTEKVIQGGVVKVQNRILKDLLLNESMKVEDKSKGKAILEKRLCKKRFLLVLDDVRDDTEMDYWITRKMLTEGSLCIVTSRDKGVFEKLNSFDVSNEIYIHNVQLLSIKNSKRVFTFYAFGGICKIRPGFDRLVAAISKACRGVPLVLKVCGALLKEEKSVDIWEEVLKKLNCGDNLDEKKIFECLRISYDALPHQQQEMFLDVACALLGQAEDVAKRIWTSEGWFAALGVRSLVQKALIIVDDKGRFTMHDPLRNMGREIERKKRESEGVYRRLWMPESLRLLKNSKVGVQTLPKSLGTLIIWRHGDPKLDLDLSHMKELRILMCDNIINVTSVPADLRWLSCRWLGKKAEQQHLHENGLLCPGGSTYSGKPPKNKLVVLDMYYPDSGRLPKSIGKLSNLEVINMSGCKKLSKLPDSFGRLRKLKNLSMANSDIGRLPKSFGELSNLEVLNMFGCSHLSMLPDSFGGLKMLRNLNLARSGIQNLPESFGKLISLEVLDLQECCELVILPDNMYGSLRNLKVLKLYRSRNLSIKSFPRSFGELSSLEELVLVECKLISLPDSFGNLTNLRFVNLAYSEIESLPECFGKLGKLEVLILEGTHKLTMLPDSIGSLTNLRKIEFPSSMERLPVEFGKLSNLEVLDLSCSLKLSVLPVFLGGLKSLRYLNLQKSGIGSLPESFGDLSNLEVLNLRQCEKLTVLPKSFGSLRQLRTLTLAYSHGIISLPESFGELSNLEGTLDLKECYQLSTLPMSFGGLKNLKSLNLASSGIESLPELFGDLSVLEVLDLRECRQLIMLPDSFGNLRNLKRLTLINSTTISSLPASFGKLSSLEELSLWHCEKLIMLPDSFGSLRNLRTLTLGDTKIKTLPESFGELRHLRELCLSWCESLNTLPQSFTRLRNLRQLSMWDCPASQSFESIRSLMPPDCRVYFDNFASSSTVESLRPQYIRIPSTERKSQL